MSDSKLFVMLRIAALTLALLSEARQLHAQNVNWTKVFGSNSNDLITSVRANSNGGYTLSGKQYFPLLASGQWMYLMEMSDTGDSIRQQGTLQTLLSGRPVAIKTSDSGYAMAYQENCGDISFELAKFTPYMSWEWQKTYSNSVFNTSYDMLQTLAGGYVISGETSAGGINSECFVVAANGSGNEQWRRIFGGGPAWEWIQSVTQASDGSFYVAGGATNYYSEMNYNQDVLIARISSSGSLLWRKTYGSSGDENANDIVCTSDGGCLVVGKTSSSGLARFGSYDIWLLRTNANGDTLWTTAFGGHNKDQGISVVEYDPNTILVYGQTESFGYGGSDLFLVATDALGKGKWARWYGGTLAEEAWEADGGIDGSLLMGGSTKSFGNGGSDNYLVNVGVSPRLNNAAPILADLSDLTVSEGDYAQFIVTGTDLDGDPISIRLLYKYTGMTFSDSHDGTGIFSWTPSYQQSGIWTTKFIASDGLLADTETVAITVLESTPNATLQIVDSQDQPVQQKTFELIELANNYSQLFGQNPSTAELQQVEIVTDENGYATAPDDFQTGNVIRVTKKLANQESDRHPQEFSNFYTLSVDNGEIDDLGNGVTYDVLSGQSHQVVKLKRTFAEYHLVVSVEWDAPQEYLTSVLDGLKLTSNYLSDVTDGQAYISKVLIADNKQHWNECDIRIKARNDFTPYNAAYQGMLWEGRILGIPFQDNYVLTPRKWFGGPLASINGSYSEGSPLDLSSSRDFRTKAHELGHYLFGFFDEYECIDCDILSFLCGRPYQCTGDYLSYNFGFMDFHYATDENGASQEPWASEMSSDFRYPNPSYQHTVQYTFGNSCWRSLQDRFEGDYDGIYADIITPMDRFVGSGSSYVMGPNNSAETPNYNVGAYLNGTEIQNNQEGGGEVTVVVANEVGALLPQIEVRCGNIEQGKTGTIEHETLGRIRCLGAKVGDKIRGSGFSQTINESNWHSGFIIVNQGLIAESISSQELALQLSTLSDSVTAVLMGDGSSGQMTSHLYSPLGQALAPQAMIVGDPEIPIPMSWQEDHYEFVVPTPTANDGILQIEGVDESGVPLLFDIHYSRANLSDSALAPVVFSRDQNASLFLGPQFSSEQSVLLLSSAFPTPKSGLDSASVRIGECLTAISSSDFPEETQLTIRYADDRLDTTLQFPNWEERIRMYMWSESANAWLQTNSVVEEGAQTVTAEISQQGTYCLFTSPQTCIDSDGDGYGDPQYADNMCPDDNCPGVSNPSQDDYDSDRIGDACDDCNNIHPTLANGDSVVVRPQTYWSWTPNIVDPDDEDQKITFVSYPDSLLVDEAADSIYGFAPRFDIISEQIVFKVEDACNVDTLSFWFEVYSCGDADASHRIDIGDAVYVVAYIFAGGAAPQPRGSGDPNCDGKINITDAVYLINYIFGGGQVPCAACL